MSKKIILNESDILEIPIICPNCKDKFGNCWFNNDLTLPQGKYKVIVNVNWSCRKCETTGLIENPERCKSFVIKLNKLHTDKRGDISKILSYSGFKTFLRITTNKGEIRGNHRHGNDIHGCYLENGKLEYKERLKGESEITTIILEPGDLVITPPLVDHAFKALKNSIMITYSTEEERDHDSYEADTTRVTLIE